MLRSKKRSGSVDITKKNNYSSVFSRTLSASKICRGDVIVTQIDSKALKSVDKKPSDVSNLPENRTDRIITMQHQMVEMEEELRRTKEKFNVGELEKYQFLDQLKEAEELAQESNTNANELEMELEMLKKLLVESRDELETKDRKIESLESKLSKELQLVADKSALISKTSLENEKKVEELEVELRRRKVSESKMHDSIAVHTERLESTRSELDQSKVEIVSLREKILSLEEKLSTRNNRANDFFVEEEMRRLETERRSAIEAEEKSTKAMEDLALALKEVSTEANKTKENLTITKIELEHVRAEAEQLKKMVRYTEETYEYLLNEAKQEVELHKNTADRLRLEAEETLLALNGKEMGFVTCIRRAEEERSVAQHENLALSEKLKSAENMTRAAREETYKLRDILKQAVNEANAAKAAAGIARDENSMLKDALSERDERLHFLTKENERLRMSEAAANENVKQLKILLSRGSMELKNEECNNELVDDYDDNDNQTENIEKMKKKKNDMMNKSFSFNLEDLKFMNEPEDTALDDDPVKAEALKGSIFDTNAETPKSEPHTVKPGLFNKQRAYLEDGRVMRKSEDFDHLSDSDSEKGSHRRVKTMFQRVGDLLTIRRSFHKKEGPVEHTVSTNAGFN